MTPDNFLPENDRDLRLAQMIEEARGRNESMESIEDSLLPLLFDYQKVDRNEFKRLSTNSSSIWSRIEGDLKSKHGPVYQLPRKSHIIRWIAAAAVVVIAFTMLYWLFEGSQPDLIAETRESISTVVLDDGSTVTLRPYSSLYEISYSPEEQIYSVSGEAYFEVNDNPNRTFVAETDKGRVVVLGTTFILQNWGDRTAVYLEEGIVRFETLDRSTSVVLDPEEFSTITQNRVTEPVLENSQVHTDWMQNILVLENQHVNIVLNEIEQHFNITIDGSNAPDETLGGSVQLESLEQVLRDLSVVLGGSFEQTAENRYEYIP